MTTIARFFKVFALGTWLGGMLFFGVMVAPILFTSVTNTDLAGAMAGLMISRLHVYGVCAAIVFLLFAVLEERSARGLVRASSIGVILMLLLTLVSQLWVIPQMEAIRAQLGSYMAAAANNPLRMHFDHLHVISTRLEGTALVIGVISLFLTVMQRNSTAQTSIPSGGAPPAN